MKKILVFIMIACYCRLQGQFVDFKENVSKDKFLGAGMSTCSTQTNHGKNSYQKGYDCGNGTISQLLNVNFLSQQLAGQQFYLFNDFMYWMSPHNAMGQWNGKDAKYAEHQAAVRAQPDKLFGSGVFMIVLGTSSYLQQIVSSSLKIPAACPAGSSLLVAQLKYNNGNSVRVWSQDAICLAPTDNFMINISSDLDNRMIAAANTQGKSVQGIDWMQDVGPAENYQQADHSPRMIRLVKKENKPQVTPVKTKKLKNKKTA